jgi:hypothetical protein
MGAGEDAIAEDMIFAAEDDGLALLDGRMAGRLVPCAIESLADTYRWIDMRMEMAARIACGRKT